jgi:hypothetical protein
MIEAHGGTRNPSSSYFDVFITFLQEDASILYLLLLHNLRNAKTDTFLPVRIGRLQYIREFHADQVVGWETEGQFPDQFGENDLHLQYAGLAHL